MNRRGASFRSGYTLPGEGNSVAGDPPARESGVDDMVECSTCHGSGKWYGEEDCPECYGSGYIKKIHPAPRKQAEKIVDLFSFAGICRLCGLPVKETESK